MPRLSRFGWQRGEPSTHEPGKTYQYHSLAANHTEDHQAAHDHSAEGWGAALYRRFWGASTGVGDVATAEAHQRNQYDAHDEADGLLLDHDHWYSPALDAQAHAAAARGPHERDSSKLGVSGWFRREASGEDDVHVNVYQQQGHQYVESGPAAPTPRRPSSSSSATASPNLRPQHHRTPSQERRAAEARHQACKKAGKTSTSNNVSGSAVKTPGSQVGDDLPAMPSPATSPVTVPLRIRNDTSPSPTSPSGALPPATHKRQTSTPSPSQSQQQQQQTPSYVRHLGRMVQRMPSILSGDSQTDNGGSRGPSESSQTHNHVGQHQHFHSAHYIGSNLGTHGEVSELEEKNGPLPGAWS